VLTLVRSIIDVSSKKIAQDKNLDDIEKILFSNKASISHLDFEAIVTEHERFFMVSILFQVPTNHILYSFLGRKIIQALVLL